jgi:hypothetical protein
MVRVSSIRLPSSKVNFQKCIRPGRWLRRSSVVCPTAIDPWRLVISKIECREQFKELSLLWAWGAELCLTIVDPSQVRSPLSVSMRAAALCHAGLVGDVAVLRAAVSSTTELVLGRSHDETSRVELMNNCQLSEAGGIVFMA